MASDIEESDWKLLRELSRVALDRFCAQVLDEIAKISADDARTNHQQYLDIYQLIHTRNKELADAFDDLRRSRASFQLWQMRDLGLLTEAEVARFSEELQARTTTT